MAARAIQVPMDDDLIKRLSKRWRDGFSSRAAFIRTACERLLGELDRTEAERRYVEGYLRKPEDRKLAQAGARLAAEVLPDEDWSS